MRSAASLTIAALVLALVAVAAPANAANPGYHAAWVAQSAYATASAGQVVQMSAVYQNTGDNPWVKGTTGQQANFGAGSLKDPSFPRDTLAYANAGWNSGQSWLSANRFAAQANDLVVTSQTGSWVWAVKVPTGQPAGDVLFHGTPVVDGVSWLEDYGFFLKVSVTLGPVLITSTSPASPSANNRPVVNGTGAGGACTITILDGGSSIGIGTSDSAGNFGFSVGPLAVGSHNLSATADCAGTFKGSGNTFPYTVTGGAPAGSATAQNAREILFNFGQCVQPSGSPGVFNTAGGNDATNMANWSIDSGAVPISRVTMNSDNQSVTVLTTTPMGNPSGHTITASNIAPCSGAVLSAQTSPFTLNDTTGPSMSSATASAISSGTTTAVTVTWSEPVGSAGVAACAGSYSIDNISATSSGHPDTSPTGQRQCTLTAGAALAAGSTHTLTAVNEKDQGNTNQAPNPASISFTVSTLNNLAISSSVGQTETTVRITWNGPVNGASGTPTCTSPAPAGIVCSNGAAAGGTSSQMDVTLTSPWTQPGCNGVGQTSCAITISETGVTGPGGTTMSPPTQVTTATIFKDTVAPTMQSTAQIGTTQTVWDITWSENLAGNPQACYTTTCPVRIKQGSTLIASSIAAEAVGGVVQLTAAAGPSANKTRVTAGSAIPGITYTLEVKAGFVTDTSIAANPNTDGTASLVVVDSTAPTVTVAVAPVNCAATQPCKTFTFTYSEKMSTSGGGSVLDTSHYRLNSVTVSGTLSINASGTVVTLVLTTDAPAGANQLSVTGVTDASSPGNTITPNPTNFNFTRTP